MKTDGAYTSSDKLLLLQNLQALLEKQIELANQGNIRDVESMTNQVNSVVREVIDSGIFEQPEFQAHREQLQKLFKDLLLVLTTQKVETAKKLNYFRRAKKAIKTYRSRV